MSEQVTIDRDAIVYAASELLKAAILLRDFLGAVHPQVYVSMPEDLTARFGSYRYQDAFDALPGDIQAEARELALTDPWLQRAREVHFGGEHQ